MKRLTKLVAGMCLGVMALMSAPVLAQERINYDNLADGEHSVNYKFWVCVNNNAKQAVAVVRLDSIVSVNKHTYTVDGVVIKECTIDTTGNNSIRFYCMNNTEQGQKMADRTKNTRKLIDSKTGGATQKPAKSFPDGTYSHNIEYLIKDSADIDTIFESAINAFIKNKGCTLKIN